MSMFEIIAVHHLLSHWGALRNKVTETPDLRSNLSKLDRKLKKSFDEKL